ncbi:MAG: hypothetical protein ABW084_09700 [Candidatus Thiodiazotropha sp.]
MLNLQNSDVRNIGDNATMTQHNEDWLLPTREKLTRWGEYLRAIKSDRLVYPSKASYLSEPGGDTSNPEDETAEMLDRLLCKVQAINFEAYRVLSMFYWLEYSDGAIGKTLQKPRLKCRELRISGEAMVAAMIHEEKKLKISP